MKKPEYDYERETEIAMQFMHKMNQDGIPVADQVDVLSIIVTRHVMTLCALLKDGEEIKEYSIKNLEAFNQLCKERVPVFYEQIKENINPLKEKFMDSMKDKPKIEVKKAQDTRGIDLEKFNNIARSLVTSLVSHKLSIEEDLNVMSFMIAMYFKALKPASDSKIDDSKMMIDALCEASKQNMDE